MVGYTDWFQLLPATAGAGMHLLGLALTRRSMGIEGTPRES